MANEIYAYPAIFDNKDNDGFYTVTFPDVPDTVTQGETLSEAILRAPDALGIALLDYKSLPRVSNLDSVKRAHPDLYVSLVAVDLKEIRHKAKDLTVRKNVTVPKSLAVKAESKGINFSQVLTHALEKELA